MNILEVYFSRPRFNYFPFLENQFTLWSAKISCCTALGANERQYETTALGRNDSAQGQGPTFNFMKIKSRFSCIK